MAIIKCPECQHEVSDQARACPFCGVDIAGNLISCPDCGKILLKNARVCPNCQCELSSVRPITPAIPTTPTIPPKRPRIKEKKENGRGLWVIFTLIFIALLGIGGYFYLKQRQQTDLMEAAYAQLKENYSIDDHNQFLKEFPNSPYNQFIVEKIDTLREIEKSWAQVAIGDTREKYAQFLQQYPKSLFTQTCTDKIDSIDWLEASTENTQESYQHYLELHGKGKFAQLARQSKEELDKLAVSSQDKATVRSIIYRFLDAVSAHDTETLNNLATNRMQAEASTMAVDGHFAVVSTIGVTKAPSSIQNVYNFVAKFKVEKRSSHDVEYFNVSSVVSPDGRVATMRLTPAQPEYE